MHEVYARFASMNMRTNRNPFAPMGELEGLNGKPSPFRSGGPDRRSSEGICLILDLTGIDILSTG
jgi:hypothetical protein